MTSYLANMSALWKNTLFTTIFCLVIALTTMTVWEGAFYIHVLISLGFGYSAIAASFLLDILLPKLPQQVEIIVSLSISLLVGTLNAQFWVQDHFGKGVDELKSVIMLGLVFTGICYYYFYTREQKVLAEQAIETLKRQQVEQEKALLLSQLKQMQSQIEPHFLFNTLANINALLSTDISKAGLMLEKLTALLRVTLTSSRESYTSIISEQEMLVAYLAIQQIRLGDRLCYEVNVEDDILRDKIPPFLIQPLVENAIKHGIEPKRDGGHIEVTIKRLNANIMIEVRDNGIGFQLDSTTTGHGVGLENIKQRLHALYHDCSEFIIIEPITGGICVQITLPTVD